MTDKKRVLVVDDEESLREIIGDRLTSEGYEVVQAEDGKKALEIIQGGEKFEFLVTDNNMPHKTGLSMILEIVENSIPFERIVLCSGVLSHNEDDKHQKLMSEISAVVESLGDRLYITNKPFDLDKLYLMLDGSYSPQTPFSKEELTLKTAV